MGVTWARRMLLTCDEPQGDKFPGHSFLPPSSALSVLPGGQRAKAPVDSLTLSGAAFQDTEQGGEKW